MISFLSKHDWLGHIVEALLMAAIVTAMFWWTVGPAAVHLGLIFAVGHFHGREKRDYEVSVGMAPPHLEAYKIWKWSSDQQTDFWPVLVVLAAIGGWVYAG